MPRSTFNFPFEARVHAAVLAAGGDLADKVFLRVATDSSEVVVFRGDEAANERQRGGADGRAFIYYDGFDVPDYAFLEWKAISREKMEAWLGCRFTAADFRPYYDKTTFAVIREGEFPADWSVIL